MKKTFLLVCALLSVKGSFAIEGQLDPAIASNNAASNMVGQDNLFSDINADTTSDMLNNDLSITDQDEKFDDETMFGSDYDSPRMDEWGYDNQSQMPENDLDVDNADYDSPRMDEWGWDNQSQMPENDVDDNDVDYDSPRMDEWGWDDQSQMPENDGDDNDVDYDSPRIDEWGWDNQSQMPENKKARSKNNNHRFSEFEEEELNDNNNNYWR